MDNRCAGTQVSFRRPFMLAGLGGIQPPGTYMVQMQDEAPDSLSFVGWRRTGCTLVFHRAGAVKYAAVDAQDLREALVRDGDQSTDPPAAPATAHCNRRVRQQFYGYA